MDWNHNSCQMFRTLMLACDLKKSNLLSLMSSFKKMFQSFPIYFIPIMTNIHSGFNVKGFLFRIMGNFRSKSFIFKGNWHAQQKGKNL